MARIYANLIIKGIITIEKVPAKYKEAVLEILAKEGYDGYGQSTLKEDIKKELKEELKEEIIAELKEEEKKDEE